MSELTKDVAAETRREEAIDWFVRQRTRSAPIDAGALQAWLDASPENADAYAEVESVWANAYEVNGDPEVTAWRQTVLPRLGRWPVNRRAMVGGMAAAVAAVAGVGIYGYVSPKPLATQSFRTAVGQQATVTLPDGSAVTLNTDTVVRTRADKDRRLVYLDRGQAFFRVAKDRGRPFVVTAAGRTVTALGTAFDVRVDQGALKVVLVEGKVRVESVAPTRQASRVAGDTPAVLREPRDPLATEMGPGSQLVVTADADWRVTKTNVAQQTSWLSGQIVIVNEPLGEAVEELNRYSDRKIVLADNSLATTRVSGIFRPGDLDAFARALETSGMAQVGEETDSELRIIAPK